MLLGVWRSAINAHTAPNFVRSTLSTRRIRFLHLTPPQHHGVDRSRVPELNESDIIEQFVHGNGPGGQAVNKLSNCVMLKHIPTGIVVRCHESRLLHENRKTARRILLEKLDELVNGEHSVAAQKERLQRKRAAKVQKRNERLRELRRQFKEREGID